MKAKSFFELTISGTSYISSVLMGTDEYLTSGKQQPLNWESPILQLSSYPYLDLLSYYRWEVYSDKLKRILTKYEHKDYPLIWLPVEVVFKDENRIYYIVHQEQFPNIFNKNIQDVRIKSESDLDYLKMDEIFVLKLNHSFLYIADFIREEIILSGCTGVDFSQVFIPNAPKIRPKSKKKILATFRKNINDDDLSVIKKNFEIPDDLWDFLISEKTLRYDPEQVEYGHVEFFQVSDLMMKSFEILTKEVIGYPAEYTHIEGVDLISECEGYDPEGILIWIPTLRRFATWDSNHWNLYLLNIESWIEIERSPIPFLNAQWTEGEASELYIPQVP